MAQSLELQIQKEELDSLLNNLVTKLASVRDFGSTRKTKLASCQKLSDRIRTVQDAFSLELKYLSDDEKEVEETYFKQHLAKYKKIQQELDFKKNEIDKNFLIEEASREAHIVEMASPEAVIKAGDEVLDQTEAAVGRMKHLVLEAEEIGIVTAAKMDEQTERLQGVDAKFDDVGVNLERSKKTVQTITRNATHDRCIQIECALMVLLVIGIILYFALGRKK